MHRIKKSNPYLLVTLYHETYAIANIVNNVLANPTPYCRNLDDFYGDTNYVNFITPFPKFSAFHQFIEFILRDYIAEDISSFDLDGAIKNFRFTNHYQKGTGFLLPINHGLNCYSLKHYSFESWLQEQKKTLDSADQDDLENYYADLYLSEPFEQFVLQVVQEVFFIMFLNRQALLDFNELIARNAIEPVLIDDIDEDAKKYFSGPGKLCRAKIPQWVKKAVYYRDRGRCVLCNKDVSGKLSLQNDNNFDHIVPLSRSGINDISNIQLLCKRCNKSKSGRESKTGTHSEKWYI